MKRLLLVALCVLAIPAAASHIVGGEFEIIHLSDNNYRVNLILYFDELNGNPGARDADVIARIFRKRDNSFIRDVFLPVINESPVSYTQPECSSGEIVTTKLIYSTTIAMFPELYDDPEGYYIVWERCCRNYTITNVRSEDPLFGVYAGQTFYLEFPAVVRNGESFINSTPQLFPPLNDYACPNRPYYVDFAGSDKDGDSLVYSLVAPLNTKSSDAVPLGGPRPRPYPAVQWRPPFGLNNIMNGAPDLRISQDGFITVTPTTQGLFVFAVRVEEYRDQVKIGEVRRDFQMLVVDRCPQAEYPQILGKKMNEAQFTYDNNMSISFANTVLDENRCIQVQVSDPDASKQDESFQERIFIKAIPLGFRGDVSDLLPIQTSATLINGDTRVFDICFPACPYKNGPYEVGIVAYDDACSLPLFDTLKVTVNVQPPPNDQPYFITPDVTAVLNEGETRTWPIQARDPDGDPLALAFVPVGFKADLSGMTFTILEQEDGLVNAQLVWDAYCDIYDFTKKTEFDVLVYAEDADSCNLSNPAIMRLKLKVNIPGNIAPVIDSDLTPAPDERVVTDIHRKVYETLSFNVRGSDGDQDFLVLDMKGVGFDWREYNITWQQASGNGAVQSQFRWDINCDNVDLTKQSVFNFEFLVVDQANKCRIVNADTLNVLVELEAPDNNGPDMLVNSLHEIHVFNDGAMTSYLGEQIDLSLTGSDPDNVPDQDMLRLELIDARGTVAPYGYIFAPAEGKGRVNTTFSWNPECDIFANGVYENMYTFAFRVFDNRCFNVKADTVEISITIKDRDSDIKAFDPPNIITPNGDDCNDYFAMEDFDPSECGDPREVLLPLDNCIRRFQKIVIYNRWGTEVFQSASRDFKWYAVDQPNGVYYYSLIYSDREYKGSVTVRY